MLRVSDYRSILPTTGYNAEGVWIDGVSPHLITAELAIFASVAHVTPIRIPGYWYANDGTDPIPTAVHNSGQQRVILYLHGGAYTILSAHPKDRLLGSLYPGLVQLTADVPHLLAVEYRLSSTNSHPFPTALLDALAGYIYLIDVMKYDPSSIIVAGESAGGNLALALTRYLVENQAGSQKDELPSLPSPPSNLLLISPWADLSNSHAELYMSLIPPGANRGLEGSVYTNNKDVIDESFVGKWFPSYRLLAFTGPFGHGMALHNRYMSPASLSPFVQARFNGFPRTLIVAGGAERFLDQIITLRDRMMKDMGEPGQVMYHEGADGVHAFIIYPSQPGRPAALKAIQDWLAC